MATDAAGGAVPVPADRSVWDRLLDTLGITARVLAGLGDRLGQPLLSTRQLGAAMAGTLLGLYLIQSALYVRSGWGVEDLLGWVDQGATGPVQAMLGLWGACGQLLAWAYLGLDGLMFVPLYAAFLLQFGHKLALVLTRERRPDAVVPWRSLLAVFTVPTWVLLVADVIENAGGLARLDPGHGTLAAAALSLCSIGLVCRLPITRQWWHEQGVVVVLITLGAAVLVVPAWAWWSTACQPSGLGPWQLSCGAHQVKPLAMGAVALVLIAGVLLWLTGAMLRHASAATADDPLVTEPVRRARLRRAMADCAWRSRYVLLVLALMTGLTVGMDQSRDVVAAIAAALHNGFIGTDGDGFSRMLGAVLVVLASAWALRLFVFSCWLWTRSACQLLGHGEGPEGGSPATVGDLRYEDIFARDWARLLSMWPVGCIVVLCGQALRDMAQAQFGGPTADGSRLACLGPSAGVLVFGLGVILGGGWFLRHRAQVASSGGYYNVLRWDGWREYAGFSSRVVGCESRSAWRREGKYSLDGMVRHWRITPDLLPIVALALLMLCRLIDVIPSTWVPWTGDRVPTMALPVILLSLAVWLSFFGWLSMLEIHQARPWVLLLVVLVGAFGALGWADNHRLWPPVDNNTTDPAGLLRMWACALLLAAVLVATYVVALRKAWAVTDRTQRMSRRSLLALLASLVGGLVVVMLLGNDIATSRRPHDNPPQASSRPRLDAALAQWLSHLCQPGSDKSASCALPLDDAGGFTVYFVSTEGGGIRAAVWTALALQRATELDAAFEARTFSISGVSGGAVGAAVYRACRQASGPASECIDRFASTDLLSPLLGAWLLDDGIARVLPTSLCRTPGCGFMSRGAWFEQGLEAAVPGLRHTLVQSGPAAGVATAHRPYLLLNATWIETGERAVASDLAVSPQYLPGARDQLGMTLLDMPLGTAAHNSARFPFINAMGSLHGAGSSCEVRDQAHAGPGRATAANPPRHCGHLGDGGYFDNSGAQTTADLVRSLARCLVVAPHDADADAYTACLAMPAAQRTWLREHLVPQVLMLRNLSDPQALRGGACHPPAQPLAQDVALPQPASCRADFGVSYVPGQPVCSPAAPPFLDLLGPGVAALRVSGIGANGQLAEARQAAAVLSAREALGGAAARAVQAPVTAINLLPSAVRYPLGWHLSPGAVGALRQAAADCQVVPALQPGGRPGP